MTEQPEPPPRLWVPLDEERRRPIVAPSLPMREAPRPFPVLATITPVLGSVAIWMLTSSPFALVFAALGPLIAVASVGDHVVGGRRRHRRAMRVFEATLVEFGERVSARHSLERADLSRRLPGPAEFAAAAMGAVVPAQPDEMPASLPVRIGRGTVRSTLRIESSRREGTGHEDARSRPAEGARRVALDEAVAAALTLHDAPVTVDARAGIAVSGPPAVMLPVARAVAFQLALAFPPATTVVSIPGSPAWSWMRQLPHSVESAPRLQDPRRAQGGGRGVESTPRIETVVFACPGARIELTTAATRLDIPPSVATLLSVDSSATVLHARSGAPVMLRPDLLPLEQAVELARRLTERCDRAGEDAAGVIPGSVRFAELMPGATGSPVAAVRSSLAAAVGRDSGGSFSLDLVRDGPHAVIGGTTGSGKSELLVTWVLALAARYPPTVVTFLLVDFKGGAAFEPLSGLPHTLGVVTDLDQAGATRAVLSLSAELRRRERILAEAGCRSIDQFDVALELPRLVIVVDEFAALVSDAPELSVLFSDLAARGRSLGIHLVLCTQRPAGVVREAVLANCTLRISLRVTTAADSLAVLGSSAAAALPREPSGRALVAVSGEPVHELQVAQSDDADRATIAVRWPRVDLARPWCPPLPLSIALDELPPWIGHGKPSETDAEIPFALADLPRLQRQSTMTWNTRREGSLLVIGRAGSGRSSTLRTIGASAAALGWSTTTVPADPADAWDVILGASDHPPVAGIPTAGWSLLIVDDVDALLERFVDDHRAVMIETLVRIVRDGAGASLHLVAGARRITPAVQPLAAVMDSRMLLALPSRHEHVLAGGTADTFEAQLPPGAGHRDEQRVQVAWVPPSDEPTPWHRDPPRALATLHSASAEGHPTAVVSSVPRRFAALDGLRTIVDLALVETPTSATAAPAFVVGTPDAWQARWSLLSAMRTRGDLIVHGCSVAEFRAVSGSRRLPPPLADPARDAWCLSRDGDIVRVRL